ncbi:MAG: TIM barrel protein [Candidatus Iainarchaeum archaeon]|uniref:TIM barrel protein n=1 Tax=Candidatus Iainarchaeum sp. TaxID=3101447 RepID=A0A7T9DK01_9ARCH|nr:MAG: TIM barrel protein [Candidatus Diapherotrites archaeon]
MHSLSFGPAGIPQRAAGKGIVRGVEAVKELGLGCMELEFVQSVYLKEEKAKEVDEARKKAGIRLSVHAPYFINLNARAPETMRASIERLYLACKMGGIAGAESVAVHAAFRHENDSKTIQKKILEACDEIYERLDKDGIKNIQIAPEYAGKKSQWGTLEEVMEIASIDKRLRWCMDFGHAHACTNGSMTSKKAFDGLLEQIEKYDKNYLKDLHIQACGITYTEKGERYHTPFESDESTLNWKGMIESLKEFKVGGMFIAETPNQEHDALLCKQYYEEL